MDIRLTTEAQEAAERDLTGDQMLRIAFAGGCGAMGFRLSACRRGDPDDLRLELGGVTLLLDRLAARELEGALLDYDEDEGFLLDHPNWGVSC
ncbi:MAG: iron-sulfur cluster insertion protein ErpA [Deltaproteobacteria bacterium]|nr:iron-sulfur cluster insertion protein ErpA [Deltaproteobacteria bacterium]